MRLEGAQQPKGTLTVQDVDCATIDIPWPTTTP